MNLSILSTYRTKKEVSASKQLKKVLLELAEMNLQCPENSQYISEEGVEKVRKKLNS